MYLARLAFRRLVRSPTFTKKNNMKNLKSIQKLNLLCLSLLVITLSFSCRNDDEMGSPLTSSGLEVQVAEDYFNYKPEYQAHVILTDESGHMISEAALRNGATTTIDCEIDSRECVYHMTVFASYFVGDVLDRQFIHTYLHTSPEKIILGEIKEDFGTARIIIENAGSRLTEFSAHNLWSPSYDPITGSTTITLELQAEEQSFYSLFENSSTDQKKYIWLEGLRAGSEHRLQYEDLMYLETPTLVKHPEATARPDLFVFGMHESDPNTYHNLHFNDFRSNEADVPVFYPEGLFSSFKVTTHQDAEEDRIAHFYKADAILNPHSFVHYDFEVSVDSTNAYSITADEHLSHYQLNFSAGPSGSGQGGVYWRIFGSMESGPSGTLPDLSFSTGGSLNSDKFSHLEYGYGYMYKYTGLEKPEDYIYYELGGNPAVKENVEEFWWTRKGL